MSLAIRLLALAALVAAAGAALGQNYPARPVRLVIGFPPGGGVDINARLLAPKLAEYLGQPFVVDNRPGAGTNIANELVAKAAPDGYTLLMNTGALAINMSLYPLPAVRCAARLRAGVGVLREPERARRRAPRSPTQA
jgi:tripartite-type tricarboxylate transporter receptor subunit TctC